MISINEAVRRGIPRLRLDRWANPWDHIEITIVKVDGENLLGPWWNLWSPLNEEINGRNPVKNMVIGPMGLGSPDDPCWSVYNPEVFEKRA